MKIIQSNEFVKSILAQVQVGRVLPAPFQRPYVWSRKDVLALLTSILRGYPIGSLLLWSPEGKADLSTLTRTRLGPVAGGADAISLLLDGQNRLATLAWLAQPAGAELPADLTEHEKTVWGGSDQLMLDLVTGEFAFRPASDADTKLVLPANVIVNSVLANPVMRVRWSTNWAAYSDAEKDAGLKVFDHCSRMMSEARLTLTDIQYATQAEAVDAFLHICKVGVPMSEADLAAALAWVK